MGCPPGPWLEAGAAPLVLQPGGRCCCKACLGLCSCDEAREKQGGGGGGGKEVAFFFFFLLRSLPRARLVHSQAGRVRRRTAGEEGVLGTSRAHGFSLFTFLRLKGSCNRATGRGRTAEEPWVPGAPRSSGARSSRRRGARRRPSPSPAAAAALRRRRRPALWGTRPSLPRTPPPR